MSVASTPAAREPIATGIDCPVAPLREAPRARRLAGPTRLAHGGRRIAPAPTRRARRASPRDQLYAHQLHGGPRADRHGDRGPAGRHRVRRLGVNIAHDRPAHALHHAHRDLARGRCDHRPPRRPHIAPVPGRAVQPAPELDAGWQNDRLGKFFSAGVDPLGSLLGKIDGLPQRPHRRRRCPRVVLRAERRADVDTRAFPAASTRRRIAARRRRLCTCTRNRTLEEIPAGIREASRKDRRDADPQRERRGPPEQR